VSEKAINSLYRIGVTGTLPEAPADKLLVEGAMGPVVDQILYDELVKAKTISNLKINVVKLNFNEKKEVIDRLDYDSEKSFLEKNDFRNNTICTIAKLEAEKNNKNVLILVKKIDHGERILEICKQKKLDCIFISGEMSIEDRVKLRHETEKSTKKVIVATSGVFSTGVSINRLHVVIFAASGKSKIQTLQSIGRGLRLHSTKTELILYDISENTKFSEKHLNKRLQYYNFNKFKVIMREIDAKINQQPY
jgi:superfamily II DNA or RNA helicase